MNGAMDANRRRLGRTEQMDYMVGVGGISLMGLEFEAAVQLVHEAIDTGVNHLDVAPTYGDAQAKMGEVLRTRRDEVFLSCKTTRRDADGALAELEESLHILGTDRIDLYQFHALDTLDDLDRVTGKGGALATFLRARDQGMIRFIGVTGHRIDVHHETIRRIDPDTVMAPLNFRTADCMCGPGGLMEAARARDMGIIAIKATTRGEIKPTADAYRFALSHDVDIAMPAGAEVREALAVAAAFQPMSPAEQASFLDHCRTAYDVAQAY
jgi:aryl-alcohol dehydrogenase-like predicted oxidoreductase